MEEQLLAQLGCLSHPQRMALFRLLMRRYPDALPAGEIAATLGLKASTASVYLSALTQAGLIRSRREGTSLRYRLEMGAARDMVAGLFVDCCRGRPDLCPPLRPHDSTTRLNVLFLCSANSARSILAEAILRDVAGDRFAAYSAGTAPGGQINPTAQALLQANGIESDGLHPQPIQDFQRADAPKMDFVFTVCDRAANEDCPAWSGQPISGHWGVPDPVIATDPEAFARCFTVLRQRIRAFAALPVHHLDPVALQRHVDLIATLEPAA